MSEAGPSAASRGRSLLVVTHAPHKQVQGRLISYAPEVCEIDAIGSLFRELVIIGPPAAASDVFTYPEAGYQHPAVRFIPAPFRRQHRLRQMALGIPRLVTLLRRSAAEASAVHIRAPSNIALVALLALPRIGRPVFSKYRGGWDGFPGEPWVYRLQRFLLRRPGRQAWVGVYPCRSPLPEHGSLIFATNLRRRDIERAEQTTVSRQPGGTRLLSAAALFKGKRVDLPIRALAGLPPEFTLTVAGQGRDRPRLEALAARLGLSPRVRFVGALPSEQLREEMARADIFILPSRTEGYPKVCLEALAHGLPCVVSDVNTLREMVDGRGLVFRPRDHDDLRDKILQLHRDARLYMDCSREAHRYSRDKSLEDLTALYRHNLRRHGIL
jgi:glycosyltransferase involved in cell wall biosynthesis